MIVAAVAAATLFGAASVAKANIMYSTPLSGPGLAVNFPKFNAAFGTLTGVTITISLNLHPSEVEINLGTAGNPFTVTLDSLSFSDTDPNSAVTTSTYDFTGNPAYTAVGLAGATGTKQTFASPDVTFTSTTIIPKANLSTYLGSGNVSPIFSASSKGNVTGVGIGQGFSSAIGFDGTATVSYSYVTPEPASLSLLALGGAALLTRRRRAL